MKSVRIKTSVKVEGLKELNKAIGELSRATARNVGNRVLVKAAQPLKETAQALSPKDTGELKQRIVVSTKKPKNHEAGKVAYRDVMQGGGSKEQATAAMREARRSDSTLSEAFVGPASTRNKQAAIKTIVQEFGSVSQPPHPYMRPAWDQQKETALNIVKAELGKEIDKAAKRAARRAARKT